MNKLKFYRLQSGLTMDQISETLEIPKSTYSKIESGEVTASEQTVKKISNLFNVPKEQLFYPVRFTIRDYKEVTFIE